MPTPLDEAEKSPKSGELTILPLEVIIPGYMLGDYISNDFKEKIKKIIGDEYSIRYSQLVIKLVETETEKMLDEFERQVQEQSQSDKTTRESKKDDKTLSESIEFPLPLSFPIPVQNFSFTHRNEKDYKEKHLVISCTDESILDKFLKSYKAVLNIE